MCSPQETKNCLSLCTYMQCQSFSNVQLCVIPWTVAHQAPLSMGFCRQNHTSGLPSPSPGYLPYPGIEPKSFMFPAFAVGSLPPAPPRKPIRKVQKGIFWSMMPWEVWNPQIKEYVRKYRKRSTENCHTIRILVFSFHVHHLSQSFKEPNCEA